MLTSENKTSVQKINLFILNNPDFEMSTNRFSRSLILLLPWANNPLAPAWSDS